MLMCSIGTWAAPGDEYKVEYDQGTSAGTETVLKIKIGQTGHLSAAIAEAQNSGKSFQYLLLETEGPDAIVTLSSEDITALNGLNVNTINLTKAKLTNYSFSNSYVNYIILPYDMTKQQVKTLGEAFKTNPAFKVCFSTSNTPKDPNGGDATLVAYIDEAGSLADGIQRTWFLKRDPQNNIISEDPATLGNKVYQGGGDCTRLHYLYVMGNFCAKDISTKGNYDENGHYIINGVADENTTSANKNTEGGTLYSGGNQPGAIRGCENIYVIDLKDGYVPDEYATDIVVGYSGIDGTSNLREIWMPEDPRFKTVPADYLNVKSEVLHQICIPGNIEYIKTRAFGFQGTSIDYVWTTGPAGNTKYDNGAYFVSGDDVTLKYKVNPDPTDPENIVFADGDDNSFQYGTITLPPNLRLIERHAFLASWHVRDVYVLTTTAPECHVDAFNSVMYHANNTVTNDKIKEEDGVKIITRDAYTMSSYQMMTMLHYPRETATPQTQRFTDPSREYNIATGDRDGNGNMLYFPTQTEFETAHAQGTYGYLWGAWNTARTWYNNEKTLGTSGGWYGDICGQDGHDTSNGQGIANNFYTNNPDEDPDFVKANNTFYDVTMSDLNQPNGYTKPDGLMDYWNIDRRGMQLYPQAVSTTSNYVYVRDDNGDYVLEMTTTGSAGSYTNALQFREYSGSADDALERYSRKQVLRTDDQGNLVYESCTNGNYVQDYEYVEDPEGNLIYDAEYISNDVDGEYVHDYTWVMDNETGNGTHYRPFVEVQKVDPYNEPGKSIWKNHYYINDNGEYVTFDQDWQYGNYQGTLYGLSDRYVLWTEGAEGFVEGVNGKYMRSFLETYHLYNETNDAGLPRFDYVDNGYVEATSADEGKQHYRKNYLGTYHVATAADASEPRYCTVSDDYVSDTEITYNKQNDYRGWHQFVLAAVAHNSKIPFEPLRSWISDNDWWTICEPYDLKYSDLIKFFGYDRQGFEKKIPYLSKLMYVIRDVENQKITLMFSKNLMEYKEQMGEGEGIVHGTISEQVKWSDAELANDPIILHAGVPYLIRPNLVAESGSFIRQFDIYKNQDPDLYQRLKDSQDISAGKQFQMIYNGEYTVPAFVVGYESADAVSENTVDSKTFTNKDGSSFTYTSGTIKYNKKDVNYKISDDFRYTFVGTLYKSAMPQYCYFLGWDSEKNRATFWYSHVLDKDGWNWNNETGIICPNFDTSLQIHQASSMNDPARWVFNPENKEDNVDDYVKCDDFPGGSGVAGAKQFTMDFGATNYSEYSETNGISELIDTPVNKELQIYNANGVYMGNSLKGLAKGIYIVNGKKYVVK